MCISISLHHVLATTFSSIAQGYTLASRQLLLLQNAVNSPVFPSVGLCEVFSRKYIFRSTCDTGRSTLIWWSIIREASRTEWLHWSIPWQCLKNPRFSCSHWYLVFFSFSNFCQYIEFKEVLVCFSNNRWTCFLIWSLMSSCGKWLHILVLYFYFYFLFIFLGGGGSSPVLACLSKFTTGW